MRIWTRFVIEAVYDYFLISAWLNIAFDITFIWNLTEQIQYSTEWNEVRERGEDKQRWKERAREANVELNKKAHTHTPKEGDRYGEKGSQNTHTQISLSI